MIPGACVFSRVSDFWVGVLRLLQMRPSSSNVFGEAGPRFTAGFRGLGFPCIVPLK